ncbi:MAG: hypothetical protein GEV28_04695 [Actinophytocola sp.]|uniref:hypothetical protein n=1 Tax=Actinophytocola sp. TaxID=1872138 RepID=UPI001326DF38|nr:hypothetical protein [Actinophytocola sp.]MPZ79718.1 hypothetical protein [Actinophytocola sp.]
MGHETALVVGGTGPTGPDVVNGLCARGYDVTTFHSGFHEVDFTGDVRHIHGDPHFPETISSALGTAEYDVVIAQYGRLRYLIAHFAGRAGHVIGIGGSTGQLAARDADVWGELGRPAVITEEQQILEADEERNTFGYRMAKACQDCSTPPGRGGRRGTPRRSWPSSASPRRRWTSWWRRGREVSGVRAAGRGSRDRVSRASSGSGRPACRLRCG